MGVVKYDRTLFEPEQDLFRESYRAFLERHAAPFREEWEKAKIVDREVWREAGKQGFLGMAVPEEFGGGGNPDFRYNVVITEETAAGHHSGLGFTLQNDVIAPYLIELATEEQKRRWLPGFCSGEVITAIAMTEPGTGSDLQGIKTRAVRDGIRIMVDEFIRLHLDRKLTVDQAAMAKWYSTEAQVRLVDRCLQLHGGYGYMREYPIARAFLDSRIQTIYGGTTEIMKEIIGRGLGV